MDSGPEYIGKVLDACRSEIDGQLSDEAREQFGALLGRLSETGMSVESLTQMYRVRDLEQFALACLWMNERTGREPVKPHEFELDTTLVNSTLIEYFSRQGTIDQAAVAPQRSVPPIFLKFFESFDTLVLQAKDSLDDPDLHEQMFDHLQEFCEEKQRELESIDEPGVSIFMNALVEFLQYVTSRKLRSDVRVVTLLAATSSDLSDVVGSGVDFNISALEKATTQLSDAKFSDRKSVV